MNELAGLIDACPFERFDVGSQILSKALAYQKFSAPRIDPLAIRLLRVMLHRGASCKKTSLGNHKRRVKVGGNVRTLPASRLIEAAVLLATENFANFGDCAKDPQSEEVTCRLLVTYDNQLTLKHKKSQDERSRLQGQVILGDYRTIPIWPEGIDSPQGEGDVTGQSAFIQHQVGLKSIQEHQQLALLQTSGSPNEGPIVQPLEETVEGRIQQYALRAQAQAVAAMNTGEVLRSRVASTAINERCPLH